MAFTYDGTLNSDLEKVRLQIGDTTSTDPLFTDEEINVYLDQRAGNVLQTAADLCDVLAVRFSREYDFETDQQSFKRSQRVKSYQSLAKTLRSRAGGISTVASTRVDGYSQDIDNEEAASASAGRNGRVRAGYYHPDLPR
jgi:hypothetical protein